MIKSYIKTKQPKAATPQKLDKLAGLPFSESFIDTEKPEAMVSNDGG